MNESGNGQIQSNPGYPGRIHNSCGGGYRRERPRRETAASGEVPSPLKKIWEVTPRGYRPEVSQSSRVLDKVWDRVGALHAGTLPPHDRGTKPLTMQKEQRCYFK